MNKVSSLIIAVAVIFPFVADHMGWWAAVLGVGQLSTAVLIVYTLTLIVIVATLLIKTTVLPKREKLIWAACLVIVFPLASLALLYRLFWNPPLK
jgi:predicted neutral ceramidase superfamily lipid hydrolase